MKRILSIWVTVCICFLFVGCEKGDEISYYTDDFLLKNGINDVECFCYSYPVKEQSIIYYGYRRGKEWFALFDKDSKALIKEWYGKEVSIDKSGMDHLLPGLSHPNPEKTGDDEYLLWCIPCARRVSTNIRLQLMHLQADGTVKYGKGLTSEDKYEPLLFLNGKCWVARSGYDNAIFDFYFENILVEDVIIKNWDTSHIYTGFQNERLWIGIGSTQFALTNEYISEKPFDRKRKIHLGYGEYKEFMINKVSLSGLLSTKWGYAFSPVYYTTGNESIRRDIILLNDGELIYYPLEDELPNSSLQIWYKESILVGSKYVISPNGEKLFEGKFPSMYDDYNIATSYTSWMEMNKYGVYMNSVDGESAWYSTSFDKQIASDAKVTFALLKQEGSIWSFRCDIVNFDGRKEEMKFRINIETGELVHF